MNKINFQNGTLVAKAKVTINGTVYEVEPAEYEGTTPLNAENLNQMQINAENAINTVQSNLNTTDQNIEDLTTYSASEEIKTGEKWIDGKSIYRKTLTFAIPTSGAKSYYLDVANLNIDTGLFDFNNSYIRDNTNLRYVPIAVPNVSIAPNEQHNALSSAQVTVYYSDLRDEFIVECGGRFNWGMATVTLRYTKTTD